MKKIPAIVMCGILAASVLVAGGCGKKSEEENQIKQLITGTPTPTVQPEADNPKNTETTDGVSMTNDYLNQKEAGEVPSISDNPNVSSSAAGESDTASGEEDGQMEETTGEDTSLEDGSGEDSEDTDYQDETSEE